MRAGQQQDGRNDRCKRIRGPLKVGEMKLREKKKHQPLHDLLSFFKITSGAAVAVLLVAVSSRCVIKHSVCVCVIAVVRLGGAPPISDNLMGNHTSHREEEFTP